jgi:carbonic anhydrase/acetyltransferase-like protein (isoleucine patch superfamily)
MAVLVDLDGRRPTIGERVFLAPTAVLIGDVRVGDDSSVWFGAVLRGDFSHIAVGERTSIQDNAVIHCAEDLPTVVGDGVTVGHGAILEGCVVADGALIGMGAIVCQRAQVRAGALVAAGAVVNERAEVEEEMLVAGVPARPRKSLDGSARHWTDTAATTYAQLKDRYLQTAAPIEEIPQCPR